MQKVITFSRHKNIKDIKEQWIELDKKAEELNCKYINYSYYQTYEWNEFLFKHIKRGIGFITTSLFYDLAMMDGKPFAIIPVSVTRMSKKARIPSCRIAGILNMAFPYVEVCDDDAISQIAQYIKERFKGLKISFADVPSCSPFAKIMSKISTEVKERESYHVPLAQFKTHEEYVASLNKNIYKNIRKAYNHLKTDDKEIWIRLFDSEHLPPKDYFFRLWQLYLNRKMAWRHKKDSTATRVTNWIKAMYEKKMGCASESLRKLKTAQLYTLEVDGALAAFMIVYRHNNHLLMPKLAIDTKFSRYSPGILLILEAAKFWIKEGVADFDMCRGDERYKREMGGINEPLFRIDIKE